MNDDARSKQSIEVEVEVPGTPEQVWAAIATGPGITAWFVPAEVDEREGGTVSLDMGLGMDVVGVVTAWDPPHRVAYEEEWAYDERPAAKLATEFLVEARSGGTCVVRVVNSFGSGADWEHELESMRDGWTGYFAILRLYLTHFPGRRCSTIQVTGNASGPQDEAWEALAGALGLSGAATGERVASAADVPALAGIVERVADDSLTLRTEQPAPGVVLVQAFSWLDQVYTSFHAYLYGDEAPAVAAREEPAWRAWMGERFPAAVSVS